MEAPKISNQQRRKLLKSAALGSGVLGASQLGTQWAKPVVDSVMLPAHAETTDDTGILPGEVGSRYSFIDPDFNFSANALGMKTPLALETPLGNAATLVNRLLETIAPTAHAAPSSLATLELFLEITAEGAYRVVLLLVANENDGEARIVFYSNEAVTLGANDVKIDQCGTISDAVLTVNSVTPTSASLNMDPIAFELLYDQDAVAPQKIACIESE